MPDVRGGPIRQFIGQKPHPARLEVENIDGDVHTIAINGDSKKKWAAAESAVGDEPIKIRAFDAEGNLLRVWRAPDTFPRSEDAKLIDSIPRAIAEISRSLAESADKACMRQAEANKSAFDALIQVVRAQGELYSRAMNQISELQTELAELAKELREQYLEVPEPAPDGDKQLTELATQVVGAALMKGGNS